MASRRHRIGSDARSDGENRVFMTPRAVAPTQMSRFCAGSAGPEKARLLRCQTSLYHQDTDFGPPPRIRAFSGPS